VTVGSWCGLLGVGLAAACSSAPTAFPTTGGSGEQPSAEVGPPPPFDEIAGGWASVPDLGLEATTGGEGGPVVTVTTSADFAMQVHSATPSIVLVSGVIGEGTRVTITSNHTIIGLPGAEFHGGLKISGGSNIIVRNLKIVGNDCVDSPSDCSAGADAFSIGDQAHHVWVDHCDISNGSDGNLDVNGGADYVTISWTKFWYSGERVGGHQFSNLVGSSDNEPGDDGHLRVSYHHVWWAENVRERMPRVRYGRVHIFNSLYTATGDNYCVGLGFYANILTEANVFSSVHDPIESNSYANAQSVVVSRGNLYVNASGTSNDRGSDVFVPSYAYALDDPNRVQDAVQSGAGVCSSRFTFEPTPVVRCTAPSEVPVNTP
jgi:pectate lyase